MSSSPDNQFLIDLKKGEEKSLTDLSARVTELEKKLETQTSNIIIGVVIAFGIALALAVLEITVYHTRADVDALDLQSRYFQEVKELGEKNHQIELRLQQEIDLLKTKPSPTIPPDK